MDPKDPNQNPAEENNNQETPNTSQEREEFFEQVSAPIARIGGFYRQLEKNTPRVYVTQLLISANAIVFIVMMMNGVHFFSPKGAKLIEWGSNFGPQTMAGEWWRLFTAMFIHGGILHLGINMWVLTDAGSLVEKLVGNVGFLVLYLFSGLAGSLTSVLWNPVVNSVGASGAIFGVLGGLAGFVFIQRESIPREMLDSLRSSGTTFLIINLVLGFSIPGIDMAAHIGGLFGGMAIGAALSLPLHEVTLQKRAVRNVLVAGGSSILLLWATNTVHPGVAKYHQLTMEFYKVESKVVEQFKFFAKLQESKKYNDLQFSQAIETKIIPPWREIRRKFGQFRNVPKKFQRKARLILQYLHLREELWSLYVKHYAAKHDNNVLVFTKTSLEIRQKNLEFKKLFETLKKELK